MACCLYVMSQEALHLAHELCVFVVVLRRGPNARRGVDRCPRGCGGGGPPRHRPPNTPRPHCNRRIAYKQRVRPGHAGRPDGQQAAARAVRQGTPVRGFMGAGASRLTLTLTGTNWRTSARKSRICAWAENTGAVLGVSPAPSPPSPAAPPPPAAARAASMAARGGGPGGGGGGRIPPIIAIPIGMGIPGRGGSTMPAAHAKGGGKRGPGCKQSCLHRGSMAARARAHAHRGTHGAWAGAGAGRVLGPGRGPRGQGSRPHQSRRRGRRRRRRRTRRHPRGAR
jgi:hypothetical protein